MSSCTHRMIGERFAIRRPSAISFEFFPPNDASAEAVLWASLQRLQALEPTFVSVTYGADGSTRERTQRIVSHIQSATSLLGAPHLTCIGATRGEILDIARRYWDCGIRHIVALRGDAPARDGRFVASADGFAHASELVSALKSVGDFEISVAAYPEKHPEAPNLQADIDNLKRKIDAGATRAITQFFYDTDIFLRFRDACVASGIATRIVPGILPIARFARIREFAARCHTSIPEWLTHRFDGLDQDPDTCRLIAAAVAIEQVEQLQRHGVEEFHFYTLNRADLTYAICHALGVRPRAQHRPVAA